MLRRAFTIFYDNESGEFKRIDFSIHFLMESVLMQADVLKDVLFTLEPEYQKIINKWLKEMEERRRALVFKS